jgi:hypothetical protein
MWLPDHVRVPSEALPDALAFLASAIDFTTLRGRSSLRTWQLGEFGDVVPGVVVAALNSIPCPVHWDGAPPSAICVRLDLDSPAVTADLRAAARSQFSELVGADGALYVFENATRSQLSNRKAALARLETIVDELTIARHSR